MAADWHSGQHRPSIMLKVRELLLVAIAIAGCRDSTDPATGCTAATGSVESDIKVSSSSVLFDWEPACGAVALIVEEDGADRWAITAPEATAQSNVIVPPVVYGLVPSVAKEDVPAQTLVPGRTYQLVLWKVMPPGNTTTCERIFNVCRLTFTSFTR